MTKAEFYNKYKTYYGKKVKVTFTDNKTYIGNFTEVIDEENAIMVNGMWIEMSEIKEMKLI